jgi:predicted DNA-binding transcriptional regulator
LPTIYQNFAEEQDVESAYKKGSLKDGDIIIYNGKLEVFRKDDIIDN